MGQRHILHCDCNCFYASVEMQEHPELRGKSIAVCGDPEARHGIVLTASYPAKRMGVKTAMPIWEAKQHCRDLIVVPASYGKYQKYSSYVREIFRDYTDQVESFGLDEAWLDITGSLGLFGDPVKIAKEISDRIKRELGITVSIGVSFNKITAKLGSDYKKPDATTCITRENYQNILWPLPARDMMGVGKTTADHLARMGIETIGDIARAGQDQIRLILGRSGETIWEYASGIDPSPVRPPDASDQPKSVGNSITFAHDLVGRQEIFAGLLALSDQVGSRLRKHGLYCSTVQIQIKDPLLATICRQQKLSAPTNVTREIYEAACAIAEKSWSMHSPVRLLSVTGTGLSDCCAEQMTLIDDTTEEKMKNAKLDRAMDSIRSRYGKDSISYARLMKKPKE